MEASKPKRMPRALLPALFHPWVWRMAWRDSRSQRLRLIVFSLAIVSGVAALTAIHSLKASVQRGIDSEAKSLLGSDLRVSSRRAFAEVDREKLAEMSEELGREVSFPSMISFPREAGARMMQVRGFDGGFPFYGKITTDPAGAWQALQDDGGVVMDPAVFDQFALKVGDEVELGGQSFVVRGVIEEAAPQGSRFSGFAPEAYVRLPDLESTELLGTNSMARHQVHLKMAGRTIGSELKETVNDLFPKRRWRLETPEDRQESIGKALDRFQQFLSLIALASLVLGAIGVAGAVQTHIARRMDSVAVLRCLGCPGQVAFAVFFVQAAALGLLGALAGCGVGILMQLGLLHWLGDELPVSVTPTPEWWVAARTTATGFAVCCGFALLPLLRVLRIPPARTLRNGESAKGSWVTTLIAGVLLSALLTAVAYGNDPSWGRATGMVAGMLVAFLTLAGTAKLLMFLTRKIVNRRWPYVLRQGVSNLHRPGNQTLLFLLSPGLGTFLLVTVLSAGALLNDQLSLQRSADSPNLYLIDVQADQVDGVRSTVEGEDLPVLESTPMVTMRVQSIRGIPVSDLTDVPKWVERREFRSTYRGELNATEEVIEGTFATEEADPAGVVPLSLEEKVAKDMKVGIGDEIVMDVQGIPITTKVTSIRRVDWSKFNLNFFMVFPPGVLEEAPGFYVVTTRTPDPESSGRLQRKLAGDFANVTAIDLTAILETVRDLLEKISLIVSVLAGFTLLAGLPILMGTLLNGKEVRQRESVLLRTLGASAGQVRTILTVEYSVLGFLSALTGVLLAVLANGALAFFVFDAPPWPDFSLLAIAFAVATGVSVLVGMWVSRGMFRRPPLAILRG
jgi:putative ABC transport system permease protein